MHTGHKRGNKCTARFPIPLNQFDQQEQGSYEYDKYSFNYYIDMGLFDVYQLHRYGGDHENDRKSGLTWLKNNLQRRGLNRPIVICQHFMVSYTENLTDGTGYTDAQRDALFEILLPYNVVCFMVGHDHNIPTAGQTEFPSWPFPNGRNTIQGWSGQAKQPPEVRPGAAFDGAFALATVKDIGSSKYTLEVLYGNTAQPQESIQWTSGLKPIEFKLSQAQELYIRGIEVRSALPFKI